MKPLQDKQRIADRLIKKLLRETGKKNTTREQDLDYISRYELWEQLTEDIRMEIKSKIKCVYEL